MGVLAETVRIWPGAVRSMHPQTSFGAVGAHAEFVTEGHALDSMLGENSPLARLEDLDAKVLLLGVGFDSCTCFHLAEYRNTMPKTNTSFAVTVDGVRKWKTVMDVSVNDEDFAKLGNDFLITGSVNKGKIGSADCYLFSLSEVVKFAEKWMVSHR
jgi:aminoglycoside 3-N-acetyltransferase